MFNIDGFEYNISCEIKRTAEIKSSEISGFLMDKTYLNDVYGTFMRYEIALEVPVWAQSRYAALYEILTAPIGWHTLVLPYNDTEITINAKIEVVSDNYVGERNGRKRWRKTTFTATANHPSKTMSLEEVITTGMTPLPDAPSAQAGDLYEYTSYGWIQRFYDDADNIYY